MEHNPRRQFLIGMLHGLGVTLLASVPGTFFYARKAWSQIQRVTTAPRTVSTVTTIKSAIAKTTPRNVIQVLKTSRLVPEDKLAVLAVRQLGTDEVKRSLKQLEVFLGTSTAQDNVGNPCGNDCGRSCGNDCGTTCGNNCSMIPASASGAFCGGGCSVKPGVTGVIDQFGKLGIDFTKINTQRFKTSLNEALKLVR